MRPSRAVIPSRPDRSTEPQSTGDSYVQNSPFCAHISSKIAEQKTCEQFMLSAEDGTRALKRRMLKRSGLRCSQTLFSSHPLPHVPRNEERDEQFFTQKDDRCCRKEEDDEDDINLRQLRLLVLYVDALASPPPGRHAIAAVGWPGRPSGPFSHP